jgi:uroporphyrinogen decarboxylase
MNALQDRSAKRSGKLLSTLRGERTKTPPVWLMRQAGRYLPEYRALRAKAGSFLNLCYDPELAAEVTLQPVGRFDLDAAILFADILLVPQALGQELSFAEGEGPQLKPTANAHELAKYGRRPLGETLAPVYETVARIRKSLPDDKALIGFAGAPWTVATYMLAGGPSDDPAALRKYWYEDREFIAALLALLEDATVEYLLAQIDAGADVVQLFDTWAGGMPEAATRALSLEPLARVAEKVKAARPGVPVILFPKGVGALAGAYAALPACDAVGIDFSLDWRTAKSLISPFATVQGGLDPMLAVVGGQAMETAARAILEAFSDVPYVFNLGHGLTPDTPPENVARLVEIVRGGKTGA